MGKVSLAGVALAAALNAAAQMPSVADYVIGAQDVLAVTVFDQADLSGKYTVEADGTFTFPLVGRVKAGGLTLRQFEAELRKQLADGYFKHPQVSVGVDQYRSQRIFVVGEVRQPGTVVLTGGMTLIEAIARAGSTLPSASGAVIIVRAKDAPPAKGPTLPGQTAGADVLTASIRDLQGGQLSQNIALRDGDTVFVPRAEFVYVFGEVKNPGSYGIQNETTVLQALSLAGGVTEHGAMNRIRIVRIVNGAKKELRVKLTDVVQPGDTIVVPQRFF
jgi:polysaccharide export outer membrane protein